MAEKSGEWVRREVRSLSPLRVLTLSLREVLVVKDASSLKRVLIIVVLSCLEVQNKSVYSLTDNQAWFGL